MVLTREGSQAKSGEQQRNSRLGEVTDTPPPQRLRRRGAGSVSTGIGGAVADTIQATFSGSTKQFSGREGGGAKGGRRPPPFQSSDTHRSPPKTTLFLLKQRSSRQDMNTYPKQQTDRQTGGGGRGCQKNPEGRKLDRQTEGNPCFTAAERHTLDSRA